MSGFEQHNEIDRFINDDMTPAERQEFQQQLNQDASLREAVEMVELANAVVVDAEVLRLKARMQAIHVASEAGAGSSSRGRWGIGLLVLLAGVLGAYWFVNQEPASEPIASQATNPQHMEETAEPLPEESAASTEPAQPMEELPTEATYARSIGITDTLVAIDTTLSGTDTFFTVNLNELEPKEITLPIAENPVKEEPASPSDVSNPHPAPAQTPDPEAVDPCAAALAQAVQYRLDAPCIGETTGKLQLLASHGDEPFTQFSLDGGASYSGSAYFDDVALGDYELLAQTDAGCATKPFTLKIGYADCNKVVQASRYAHWELELPNTNDYPLTLEIRHARTGGLAYERTFGDAQYFEWKGTDASGTPLPMGNYIYLFKSSLNGIIAKGQVVVIE